MAATRLADGRSSIRHFGLHFVVFGSGYARDAADKVAFEIRLFLSLGSLRHQLYLFWSRCLLYVPGVRCFRRSVLETRLAALSEFQLSLLVVRVRHFLLLRSLRRRWPHVSGLQERKGQEAGS